MRLFRGGCDATRLLDGVEGRLPLAARLDLESHLTRCAGCADDLADLAAARLHARRSLATYRSARTRISPVRARLAARAESPNVFRRLGAAFARVGRPAEAVLALAMLAFAFVGTLGPLEQREPAVDTEPSVALRQRLDPDDPAWPVRFRYRPSPMVYRSDFLSADSIPPAREDAVDGQRRERPRPVVD